MTAKKERRLKTILTTYCRVPRAGYVECDWVEGEWKPVGKYRLVFLFNNSNHPTATVNTIALTDANT